MKINLPVTQSEIPYPKGRYLVSRTDLKGIITDANDAFIEISGFPRDELIGKNHNVVRHPEMPPQVFEDLWATIKTGKPWNGLVKNRSKSGDFYWVNAFVIPVHRNGTIEGYMSVRSEPKREHILQAEALYSALKQSGKPIRHPEKIKKLLNIRTRLAATMSVSALLVVLGAVIGLHGIQTSNQSLQAAYSDHFEPVLAARKSLHLMDGAFKHVALALEHSPDSRYAKSHDHPLAKHTDNIGEKIATMHALHEKLQKQDLDADERRMVQDFVAAEETYIQEGLQPALDALKNNRFDTAQGVMLAKISPLYETAKGKAETLEQYFDRQGETRKQAADAQYADAVRLSIIATVASLLLMLLLSQLQARAIIRPLRTAVAHFDRIAEGDLTEQIDLSRHDEIGELFSALAMMQTNLKVMLDDLRTSVMNLQQSGANLDAQMFMVRAHSEQQQEQVRNAAAATEAFQQSVADIAGHADKTAQEAHHVSELVGASNQAMSESMAANSHVMETVNTSGQIITDLSQRIEKIGDITQAIKEIAEQTNLLALNAAIEAARAGESGRGFAVVADEVRKLAVRTAESTASITQITGEIRSVSNEAVEAMQQAVQEVHLGIGKMTASVDGLNRITEASRDMADMSRHIAEAAAQQAQAGVEVSDRMGQLSSFVQENTLIAQQAQALSIQLSATGQDLNQLIGGFKLSDEPVPVPSAGANSADDILF